MDSRGNRVTTRSNDAKGTAPPTIRRGGADRPPATPYIGLLLALAAVAAPSAGAGDDDTEPSADETVERAATDDAQPHSADPKRAKLVETLHRRLGRIKPYGTKRKSLDDCFVVGMIELDRKSGQADVRFQMIAGQRQTAETLFDYAAVSSVATQRRWEVFYRVKDRFDGERAVGFLQDLFDVSPRYRFRLMRAYGAKSIRRPGQRGEQQDRDRKEPG